jgi:esterase/lipase superfamily enzyme
MSTEARVLEPGDDSGHRAWKYAVVGTSLVANIAIVGLILYGTWVARIQTQFSLAVGGRAVNSVGTEAIARLPADDEGRQPRTGSRPQGEATHVSYPVYFGTDRSRALPFNGSSLTQVVVMLALGLIWLLASFVFLRIARAGRWRLLAIVLLLATVGAFAFLGWDYLPVKQRLISDVFAGGRAELQCGICLVAIPHSHKPGALEGPSLLRFEFRENPEEHVALEHVQLMTPEEFRNEFRGRAEHIAWREALVFIHGYNNSFEDAARRTAQLGYDLEFGGIMAFFSWPSANATLDYTRDSQNAIYASPHLKEFLELLAKEGKLNRIHVIAHSMGNQCLAAAVRTGLNLDECRFDECILAAPDIDAQIFRRDFADGMSSRAGRLSLYASRNDRALKNSRVPNGYPRLGDCDPMTVLAGMESIDVSRVATDWLGHSSFAADPNLINVIRQMIEDNLPASARVGMQEKRVGETLRYWEFVPADTQK